MNIESNIVNFANETNSNIAARPGIFDAKEIKNFLSSSKTPFVTVENETIAHHDTARDARNHARQNKCVAAVLEGESLTVRNFA